MSSDLPKLETKALELPRVFLYRKRVATTTY